MKNRKRLGKGIIFSISIASIFCIFLLLICIRKSQQFYRSNISFANASSTKVFIKLDYNLNDFINKMNNFYLEFLNNHLIKCELNSKGEIPFFGEMTSKDLKTFRINNFYTVEDNLLIPDRKKIEKQIVHYFQYDLINYFESAISLKKIKCNIFDSQIHCYLKFDERHPILYSACSNLGNICRNNNYLSEHYIFKKHGFSDIERIYITDISKMKLISCNEILITFKSNYDLKNIDVNDLYKDSYIYPDELDKYTIMKYKIIKKDENTIMLSSSEGTSIQHLVDLYTYYNINISYHLRKIIYHGSIYENFD